MKTLLTLILSILFLSNYSNATVCSSLGNGDWNNPAVWSCGVVPGAGDTIIINAGDSVDITSTNVYLGAPMVIIINGYLLFNSAGAKLHLPCGSEIYLNITGQIADGGVGVPSHNIKICDVLVWEGRDGPLFGPIILTGPTPLPVELVYFKAENEDQNLLFEWKTVSESNNDFFSIEGSVDGVHWEVISNLNGAGTSLESIVYYESIDGRTINFSYFKLKQTDFDGSFTYSDVIRVKNDVSAAFGMYPNPLNGQSLKLNVVSKGSYDVTILDLNGASVFERSANTSKEIWLNDLQLRVGLYIVVINDGVNLISEKLVVQ